VREPLPDYIAITLTKPHAQDCVLQHDENPWEFVDHKEEWSEDEEYGWGAVVLKCRECKATAVVPDDVMGRWVQKQLKERTHA
jgi:hypothetical protein